jgi:hypothetical protein
MPRKEEAHWLHNTAKETYRMDKTIKIIFFLILLFQNISCQKMKEEQLPEFNVEISSPNNNMIVTPVEDKIITLEGVPASLPYGSSSGTWGNSGKGWTEQQGTPVGIDVTYFSRYEDTFYHLKADFPVEKIKDYMQRAYAQREASFTINLWKNIKIWEGMKNTAAQKIRTTVLQRLFLVLLRKEWS